MNRFFKAIVNTGQGFIKAVTRFPLTVVCLACATIVTCYMISLHKTPDLFIQKLLFTFGLGTFLTVAAQFCCERFKRLQKLRLLVYVVAALLVGGYYLIIASAPSIDYAVRARTFVAVFAMFCIYIWVPSYKGKADFNSIALTHFKSTFTSILFSAVLAAGISSIIAAIDTLLFKVNEDSYTYTMAIIWIFFATTYYLSRLPGFNSETEEDVAYTQHAASYPQILKILISYITVPLIAAYSLVLIVYFGKIPFTFKWPSGQLGPMILAYSAIGLIVYVLASHLEDKFAAYYRKVFPKVLILMVIMQLISVYIRLNAYGVTEARYYLILFGVYSLICGVVLSFKPVGKNFIIALLGACLAIVSVIPPVDAFTVSRNSQITRLEQMLTTEGVLAGGKITPKADVTMRLRLETTNILNYLGIRNYLQYLAWLPADFRTYDNQKYGYITDEKMKSIFGFETAYEAINPESQYFYAGLDMQKPFSISGYDIFVTGIGSYRKMLAEETPKHEFQIRDKSYELTVVRLTPQEVRVSVKDAAGTELVSTGLYEFASNLSGIGKAPKESLPPEAMTLNVENNGYKLKVLLQNINMTFGTGAEAGVDYDFFILFGAPIVY